MSASIVKGAIARKAVMWCATAPRPFSSNWAVAACACASWLTATLKLVACAVVGLMLPETAAELLELKPSTSQLAPSTSLVDWSCRLAICDLSCPNADSLAW